MHFSKRDGGEYAKPTTPGGTDRRLRERSPQRTSNADHRAGKGGALLTRWAKVHPENQKPPLFAFFTHL